MASIALSKIWLRDSWPGVPNCNLGIPTGGFDATAWNFSTADDTAKTFAPPYPPGTKITAYTDNSECPGWYTMIYLARQEYSSECISSDTSEAIIFCGQWTGGAAGEVSHTAWDGVDTTTAPWYFVQSCYTGSFLGAGNAPSITTRLVVTCTTTDADSSITHITGDCHETGYGHAWGWFWCGGVCPCKDITFLKGLRNSLAGAEITTDTNEVGALYPFCGTVTFMLTSCPSASDATVQVGSCPLPVGFACASAAA